MKMFELKEFPRDSINPFQIVTISWYKGRRSHKEERKPVINENWFSFITKKLKKQKLNWKISGGNGNYFIASYWNPPKVVITLTEGDEFTIKCNSNNTAEKLYKTLVEKYNKCMDENLKQLKEKL